MPQSSARLRLNVAPTHSLHRPTVLTAVSRVTHRHSAVSGLVTLTNHASGATVSMSRGDVEHHRHAAQRAQQATRADAVADRLADPVAARDLDVVLHAVEAADREARDHEVGTRERRACDRARRSCVSPMPRRLAISPPSSSISFSRSASRSCSTTVGLAQRRRVREVAQQARRPVVAASADDDDLRSHDVAPTSRAARPRLRSPPLRRAGSAATPIADRLCRPAGAEHVGEQPARAVDDGGLLHEPGRRRDEAQHREHPLDPVEAAQLAAQHRQRVERAPPRRLGALLHAEVEAEHARVHERALVVARQLARRAHPASVRDHRVERIVRRVRAGQREPQLTKPRFGAHAHNHSFKKADSRCRATGDHRRTRRARPLRAGAPSAAYTVSQRCDRLARGVDREDEILDAVLGEQRAAAR